ncbi:MAG TPA: sulfotransferase, partial [Acidobacteriaceae bacterium]|nr:sulfotransferase [Acidobacteriaceae bacterium]
MQFFYRSSEATAAIQENGRDLCPASAETAICQRDLPSFLVLGPPRTGTSWLHDVLSRHARLPEPTKETRFFDRHFERGLSWYLGHFPVASGERLTGEVAPTYFASPAARHRVARTLPHAKLVVIFRHPVQRLVSMYRMKRAYGMFGWSLEEALERDPELMASGRYATHLRQWQSLFSAEQIRICLFDELSRNPQAFVDRVAKHVGIARFSLHRSQLAQVYSAARLTVPRSFLVTRAAVSMADWCKARRFDAVVAGVRNSGLMKLFVGGGAPFPEVPSQTLARITDLLLPEIEELEAMLDRDL